MKKNLKMGKFLEVLSGDQSRDYQKVIRLLDGITAINSTLNFKELLYIILGMMIEMVQGDRGILITYHKKSALKQVVAQDKLGREISPEGYLIEVVEQVQKTGLLYLSSEDQPDPEISSKKKELGIKRVVCVPLILRGMVLGAVYVDSRESSQDLSTQDKTFFQALCGEMELAIEKTTLYEENLHAKMQLEHINNLLQNQVDRQSTKIERIKSSLAEKSRILAPRYSYLNIVGKSKKIQTVFDLMDKIRVTELPVLIQGESGTGKELIAQAIHYGSPRKGKNFIPINCAALSETLLESELFGYVKGAFTGALKDKIGLFELAQEGTLFLDEVGDMSYNMQKKLLRVLQEKEVRPLGGKEEIKVDVRILCASNRKLKKMVDQGDFRSDLYYRLNVIEIQLPPLRERTEDIPLLADRFLAEFAKESKGSRKKLAPEALKILMTYPWPGNIRELKNVIERSALICSQDSIQEGDILLDFTDYPNIRKAPPDPPSSVIPPVSSMLQVGEKPSSDQRVLEKLGELLERLLKENTPSAKDTDQPPKKEGPDLGEFFSLSFPEAKEKFLKEYLKNLLIQYPVNMTYAAKKAGVIRSYLYKLLKRYNLEIPSQQEDEENNYSAPSL